MRVAVITSGYFPVPASKGGAVEVLDEYLIEKNEKYKELQFEILSIYDEKAVQVSRKYKYSNFIFIKPSKLIKALDLIVYHIVKDILKKEKHMSFRYIIQRLFYINEVSKILEKNNYDKVVLENHSTLFMALKRRENYKKYSDKYYYHLHNEVANDYNCKEIMRNCKKVLGVSNYINKTFVKFIGEIEKSRIDVLKNCVDTERFNKETNKELAVRLKEKFLIKENEKVIIFTGRLNKEKGIRELLIALKKIKHEQVKLLIVGSYYYGSGMVSDFEKELNELAEDKKDKIIFTGFVSHYEMPGIYSMADIVIVPSIWNDPAPLTVIEAMSSGVPLITTASGGICEYANNKCAIILKVDSKLVDNLAEAVDKILNDEELRRNMQEACIKSVLSLNLDRYYKDFVSKIM
jgi:glycosyltransferase involved in cell wall biosynthesis